ncbi:MAG: hypothetical protein RIS85_173, partial [Pseudomonadota bacterium]
MRAVSLADLGHLASTFAEDRRFFRELAVPQALPEPDPIVPEAEPHDPVADAWADGYARGMGEAQEAAAQIIAEREAA